MIGWRTLQTSREDAREVAPGRPWTRHQICKTARSPLHLALMGHTCPRGHWKRGAGGETYRIEAREEKKTPTGGGAIYPQTGPSHACVEAKEGVDRVLGALGEAQDPHIFYVEAKPLARKSTRPPEVRYTSWWASV